MQNILTENVTSADNQQERLDACVSDDYLVGFVEGEGNFYIGIVPSKETKTGWQVIHFFKVSQNPSGREVLEYFIKRFGCGYIKANSNNDLTDRSLAYVVRDLKNLREKVIPFFEGKLVIKLDAFEKFKRVVQLVSEKKHLTLQGVTEIVNLAYSMNTGKRKFPKELILEAYTNLESSQTIRQTPLGGEDIVGSLRRRKELAGILSN